MPLPPLPHHRSLFSRCWGWFKAIVATSCLLSVLLLLNVLQTLSVVLILFSHTWFRAFNRWCANFWWGWCVRWSRWYGTKVHFYGDSLPAKESVLLVSNHQEMSDILALFFLAQAKERLGDLKFYAKDILKYVPGVGWGMLFLDCIFVKRNWTADRDHITATFAKIIRHNIPLWLVSFVEGTRVRPAKLEASRRFAQQQGLTPLRHVLIPRTKGFVATVIGLRNQADAVYDVTIGYEEGVPTLWQWSQGRVQSVHIHVKRFPMATLPEDETELADWLMARFVEKDQLLDQYYRDGAFPDRQ